MKRPSLTVVIPTLNEERYLPRLLRDLTQQTFKDFEVIIVDGKSDDHTKEKADSFSSQLRLKFLQVTKRNVSYQRNFGIQKAKSEIVVLFDADTQIPTGFLDKIQSAFTQKDPDALTTWIKSDSKDESEAGLAWAINAGGEIAKFFGTPAVNGAMIAVKKDVAIKVGGFNEKMKFGEDTDFVRRIVKKGYTFDTLRKVYYQYSFRRFRKEGVFTTLQKTARLNFSIWLKNDKIARDLTYPMGGHVFAGPPKTPAWKHVYETFSLLSQFSKSKKRRPKAPDFLQKLIADLKEN